MGNYLGTFPQTMAKKKAFPQTFKPIILAALAVELALLASCAGSVLSAAQASPTPSSPDPLPHIRALADQGHLAEAEASARTYLTEHAASPDAHYLLAYLLFRQNRPLPSLAEYTLAAGMRPPDAQQLSYVALDYVLAKDYADADKWMTRVTQWTPSDAEAWYRLGRIKYTENLFDQAIYCFQKSLTLEPRSVKAENNLGLAYEGLNQADAAIAAYRQAIAWQLTAASPSEQPLVNLASLLLDRNQLDEAQPLLTQAVSIAPNDARIRVTLGRLYRMQGNLHEAQTELERAVTLKPDDSAYHYLLGQVYQKSGLIDKARSQFAEAAATKTNQP